LDSIEAAASNIFGWNLWQISVSFDHNQGLIDMKVY